MTDQLSLSIWLERSRRHNRLREFERLLLLFPFSQRAQPQSTLSIQAIDSTEPPLFEQPLNGPVDVAEVIDILSGYGGEDVAYRLESWWDVWQFEGDWSLAPARVMLSCFGSEFDSGGIFDDDPGGGAAQQEDLRIDFGVDSHYLPRPDVPGSARLTESNIKSLLRLVHELDATLPVLKRKLETESGENFAQRLQQSLESKRAGG